MKKRSRIAEILLRFLLRLSFVFYNTANNKTNEALHMDIFSFISLFGGLAFFLYGMKVMSDGLEKVSGGKMNQYLKKVTDNKWIALLFGIGMTIAVQSSSAVTVMLVGLVNSGMLTFGQTIGVLMGSNIGTTLTAWILSLAGIESDVFWLNLLKPTNFSPLFALIGIILLMIGKQQKSHSIGNILIGFAVLMFGMNLMSDAMEPLAAMPEFTSILTAFENPVLAVLVGAVLTGIIQSSAASVAILQALSLTGGITYGIAIPIIMGQNIGTCVTALLSSIGVSRNAKKVAVVHLSFNLIGTLICLIPFCVINAVFHPAVISTEITPFMIAVCHSIFNILTTFILFPFTKQLEYLANKVIPELGTSSESNLVLDERILSVPSIAVERSMNAAIEMCCLAENSFVKAITLIPEYNEQTAAEVIEMETELDHYEDKLATYMMKLSKIEISEYDSKCMASILYSIDDFERIGDHAVGLVMAAKEMNDKKITFSTDAYYEIAKISEAVLEILKITVKAFSEKDLAISACVEPLEEVINTLILETRRNHISRLQRGNCTIDLGFILSDILTAYERTAAHCSNIAVAIIEAQHGSFDTHEYLDAVKNQGDAEYAKLLDVYTKRFSMKL